MCCRRTGNVKYKIDKTAQSVSHIVMNKCETLAHKRSTREGTMLQEQFVGNCMGNTT